MVIFSLSRRFLFLVSTLSALSLAYCRTQPTVKLQADHTPLPSLTDDKAALGCTPPACYPDEPVSNVTGAPGDPSQSPTQLPGIPQKGCIDDCGRYYPLPVPIPVPIPVPRPIAVPQPVPVPVPVPVPGPPVIVGPPPPVVVGPQPLPYPQPLPGSPIPAGTGCWYGPPCAPGNVLEPLPNNGYPAGGVIVRDTAILNSAALLDCGRDGVLCPGTLASVQNLTASDFLGRPLQSNVIDSCLGAAEDAGISVGNRYYIDVRSVRPLPILADAFYEDYSAGPRLVIIDSSRLESSLSGNLRRFLLKNPEALYCIHSKQALTNPEVSACWADQTVFTRPAANLTLVQAPGCP